MLRRNLLIFHQAALGDFIVTWPLAMALSRVYPQSRIIYVTHSQKGRLAERVLRVEWADSEAGWHGLLVPPPDGPHLPERSARLLAGAHLCISFTAGQFDAFAEGIHRAAPELPVISLDTRSGTGGHVTHSLIDQLFSSPGLANALRQMLKTVADRGIAFGRAPGRGVAIHPGAGKEQNRWPAERYLELVQHLRDRDTPVTVLLGEVELEKWPRALIAEFESRAEVRRPSTLLELLDEIAAAAAFVGNDSGPAHLAGIIGVPSIALFGADPARWRPLGPRVSIIHCEPLMDLPMERVLGAVVAALEGRS